MKLYKAKRYFYKILKENMSATDLSSGSCKGGSIINIDSYAPGDNRIPTSIFSSVITRKKGSKKKRKPEEDSEELFDFDYSDLTDEEREEIESISDKTGRSIWDVTQEFLRKKGTLSEINKRERLKTLAKIKKSLV